MADQAKRKQQTQIKLIVDNLSISVKDFAGDDHRSNTRQHLYHNVISNVSQMLSSLEDIVRGIPQRVETGAVLIGLISWHLYPDLVVLGQRTVDVYQTDKLVRPGGIVTIGIAKERSDQTSGVYWSLCLSSLRYYGVVVAERSSLDGTTRLSIPQLQWLALGAAMEKKSVCHYVEYAETIGLVCRYLRASLLKELCESQAEAVSRTVKDLFSALQFSSCFAAAVESLQSSSESDQVLAGKLVRYGARHGRNWMNASGRSQASLNFFGLTNLRYLLLELGSQQRLLLLRKICQACKFDGQDWIIRYRTFQGDWAFASVNSPDSNPSGGNWSKDVPHSPDGTRKRKRDANSPFEGDGLHDEGELYTPNTELWIFMLKSSASAEPLSRPSSLRFHSVHNLFSDIVDDDSATQGHEDNSEFDEDDPAAQEYEDKRLFSEFVEDYSTLQDHPDKRKVFFDFLFGDQSLAAVYKRREDALPQSLPRENVQSAPLELVRDMIQSQIMTPREVSRIILRHLREGASEFGSSLLTLGHVSHYYQQHLPKATVAMSVIKSPIPSWEWCGGLFDVKRGITKSGIVSEVTKEGAVKDIRLYQSPLSRPKVFAMILQFESGTVSAHEQQLQSVFALCRANSMFVAGALITDPSPTKGAAPCVVEHVIGNIGKPGIALLVSPGSPEIKQHEMESWHCINHAAFTGERAYRAFTGTSLHLSFTGYEAPLSTELLGLRGKDAFFLEARVSANDEGAWFADLDILRALENNRKIRHIENFNGTCEHHEPSFTNDFPGMTCIDNWEEYLDPPENAMVVRASDSWMARLAAVGVASSKGYVCRILQPEGVPCWRCAIDSVSMDDSEADIVFVM